MEETARFYLSVRYDRRSVNPSPGTSRDPSRCYPRAETYFHARNGNGIALLALSAKKAASRLDSVLQNGSEVNQKRKQPQLPPQPAARKRQVELSRAALGR